MKRIIGLLILIAGSASFSVHATNSASREQVDQQNQTSQTQINNINPVSGNLNLGDYYQGGVIYWLDSARSNKHGLIVDINDAPHSSDYSWDTTPPSKTGALGNKAYAGKNNTQIIISLIGSTRAQAAYACVSSTSQGYSDWYLPSEYELALLLKKQGIITKTAKEHGGNTVSHHPYWSSTEYARNSAMNLTLSYDGGIHATTYKKNSTLSVRCVRAF